MSKQNFDCKCPWCGHPLTIGLISTPTMVTLNIGEPTSCKIMDRPVDTYGWSTRVRNVLYAENIVTFRDICKRTRQEWRRTPNFGTRSLNEIEAVLEEFGFSLAESDNGGSNDSGLPTAEDVRGILR